jgi:Tol biopolymer transport system component
VDPVSGDASLLISSQELESDFEGEWSRDGTTIFNRFTEWKQGIFRFRLDTKARRVLYVPPKGTDISQENLALSPDGKWLAFHARQKAAGMSFLMVMPSEGGQANPLLTISSPEEFAMGSFAWTPDSRTILAVRTTNKGAYSESSQLWKVPIDGSRPARLDFPEMRMAHKRISPDGQTIAFTSGRAPSEIFVLQGLP